MTTPPDLDIPAIRAEIPALYESVYLNTGTFGPMPRLVADELRRVYGMVERLGPFSPDVFHDLELGGVEKTRHKVASLIHAHPDEVAFTHNVTDGINIVLHGLDWSPGDEIILTDQEHPAGTVPWLALAERRGVVLRLLPVTLDAGDMLTAFERLVGPRTRLACFSHVSCMSGIRLPVTRLCAVARAAGVRTLVDGAHAEGQFAVDVPAIGADFYAACGHKWLLGPQGTGFLYVRQACLPELRPAWLGWGVNKPFHREQMRYELESSAARFEQSTQPWPLYLALGQAINFIQAAGLEQIEARVRLLVAYFRQRLGALSGISFFTPSAPNQATGLVTCSLPGFPAGPLRQRLWEEHRILTNHIQEFNALRFSVAFYNTEQELDTAADALAELVGQRG
jgi:selenocysteine lyase/cysteine desulfurase